MDGIEGLLARDFGVRPQGKAAPMASSRAAGSAWPNPRSTPASTPSYDDLFCAPAPSASASSPSLDSFFDSFKGPAAASSAAEAKAKLAPAPASAYDDDIFDAIPGLKPSRSTSSAARYDGDDVFGAAAPAYDDVFAGNRSAPPSYDDLLGGFGGKTQEEKRKRLVAIEENDLLGGFGRKPQAEEKKKPVVVGEDRGSNGFDDLIPGFTSSSSPQNRKINDNDKNKPAVPCSKSTASTGRFTDPLVDLDKSARSEGKNVDNTADNDSDSSVFDQFSKSVPLFTSEMNGGSKDSHQPSKARDSNPVQNSLNGNPAHRTSMEDLGNIIPKSQSARYYDVHGDVASSERYSGNGMEDQSPRSTESEDDIWLTVSEIPLFTRPTSAPPPSRSPPLLKQKPLDAKANGFDDDKEFERNLSDHEEKERQERLEQEREMRLREEKEREKIRLEKERELEQQRKRERERQAMERATKEARDRAAAEARAKTEREAYQRAAVQRAHQEARERAAAEAKERVARAAAEAKERVARAAAEERERAATEERERAAAEAKERERAASRERAAAERAAAEKVQQEARKRAERAAMERAAAEARERQAAAAAAAARQKQSTPDDLESFFGVDARANSAPKQRSPTVDSFFDPQRQGRGTVNGSQRAASTSAPARKASAATNIGDDLFDIFGATPSSEVFQEVEGESEERRRSRLERHQRTRERAAKALAEKNERDMQVQREQAERDRISDTLDFEIKRWASGKEGNLRALLSTLQYILWAECGWQAVSLTDLITGAAVKKQYRKATLCIHPDKVQQKGATLQQKYIAEKVFDMLKEAWNKFNSEELF